MWPGSGDAQGLTLRIFFFLTEKKKSDFCVTVGKKKNRSVAMCPSSNFSLATFTAPLNNLNNFRTFHWGGMLSL